MKIKKRVRLLLALLMSIAIFASCKQTPADVTVVKKDSNEVIKKATMKQTDTSKIPEEYKDSFENKKKTLSVDIDAKVKYLENASYPVIEVEKREFTQEEADRFINVFIGKKSFYQVPEEWTKAEIEDRIIALKKDMQENGDVEDDRGHTTKEEINLLKEKLKKAPAQDSVEQASKKFITYKSGKRIFGYCNEEDGRKSYLSIENSCVGNQVEVNYSRFKNSMQVDYMSANQDSYSSNIKFAPPKVTKEEAQKQAEELLNKLGIKDFSAKTVAYAIDTDKAAEFNGTDQKVTLPSAYFVVFTRDYDGTPSCLQENSFIIEQKNQKSLDTLEGPVKDMKTNSEEEDEADYTEDWYYESIKVLIDDSGVIGFHYGSPSNVVKKVTKNSTILPFKDVTKIMKRMILVSYDVADEAYLKLKVNHMALNLVRIKEKNERTKALYVPVWTLTGDISLYYDKNKTGPKEKHEHIKNTEILSLNAVDGTMININEFSN